MFKRPHYIALGLIGLLTLIILNLPHHTASQIKLAIGGLFLPLFGLSKSTQQITREAGDALVPRAELRRQNEQLRQTNEVLKIRTLQMETVLRENDRLRQLFNARQKAPYALWNPKLARVVAQDPANWWQTIQIDVGSRDGIQINSPVLVPEGLVGKIISVGLTTSQVALVGNPNCKVAATIEKGGEKGVITGGASALDNTLVNLSFLSGNSNVKPGQKVTTSGDGGLFRPGIPIGLVAEEPRQAEIGYNEVRVKLAVNLNALEEVLVLMP
jgi:rod shape-determining protein MreC